MEKNNRIFTEQEQIRREKLFNLIKDNRNPFLEDKFIRTHSIKEVSEKYNDLAKEELKDLTNYEISIAGRIKLYREAGKKAVFANIEDENANIQIYIREDVIGSEEFEYFKNLDLGDIIGVFGTMMKTDHGELTLRVQKYKLLTKSLKPLPNKHLGLVDIEEKYRRRYVDLIMNQEVRDLFKKRTKIIRTIQNYMDSKGYIEVETPILHSVKGGAAAKPFETHYNALDTDVSLRIATELHLKRLIVGGYDGVYEIGRIFRNEGMSTRHNPEFTTIEGYIAYCDMLEGMGIVEEIIRDCNKAVGNPSIIPYSSHQIDLGKPFKRLHMVDSIKDIVGVDFWEPMTYEQALKIAQDHKVHVEKHNHTVGHIINLFFEEFVESTIVQPTFIYGHPKEISPLSKSNCKDPRFTDRFELFIIDREYANAFSELNDPIDQYERFNQQIKEASFGNEEATEMDIDFIEALEYGMPPTFGFGLGIDRLTMLLTNQNSIKDVLLFPQMKPRENKKGEQ